MIYWTRIDPPPGLEHCQAWKLNGLRVFFAQEDGAWHLSISHPTRLPTWAEVRDARYHFLPDNVVMAMLLPPRADYLNVHEYCFHLWEIQGEEAMQHAPSLRKIIVP